MSNSRSPRPIPLDPRVDFGRPALPAPRSEAIDADLPATAANLSTAPRAQPSGAAECVVCGLDVANSLRGVDGAGRSYCSDCWGERTRMREATEVAQAPIPRRFIPQQAIRRASEIVSMRRRHSAEPDASQQPVLVYVAPENGSPQVKGQTAFYVAFYTVVGIALALGLMALGGAGILLLYIHLVR